MRRKLTPEQLRIYEQQMRERNEAMIAQLWTDAWLETNGVIDAAQLAPWVRSRPRVVQELMLRFPPHSLVRAKPEHGLIVPAPGTMGIVVSYRDDGAVFVVQGPRSIVRCQCQADWLELAACAKGASVEDIDAMLASDCTNNADVNRPQPKG